MKEDLLHFIWHFKKLPPYNLITTEGQSLEILDHGQCNRQSGPDFFNAKVRIDGQLWAGNVEIHLWSSLWYAHGHETDRAYDNVILHVVWEDDIAVLRKDHSSIPTLELKDLVSEGLLENYRGLLMRSKTGFINCEKALGEVNGPLLRNWLERLYLERLEQRSEEIFLLLDQRDYDWENVCFILLARGFGLSVNRNSFFSLARALDFSTLRKLQSNPFELECVFFGMTGLLENQATNDTYYDKLREEYRYLKRKFKLRDKEVVKAEFFRLRPSNFPTVRLSQMADLYHRQKALFSACMKATSLTQLRKLLKSAPSSYWQVHYTFGKTSRKYPKYLTSQMIDLLLINAILPLKFCYASHYKKDEKEKIISLINGIRAEQNGIVESFGKLGLSLKNAMDSQAVLQLYREYCSKNNCLRCAIGVKLLNGK